MPSANTQRPISGRAPIASSLWSLTLPTSVTSTCTNFPLRLIRGVVSCLDRADLGRLREALPHCGSHLGSRLKAVSGILRERPIDDAIQPFRQVRTDRGYGLMRLVGDQEHKLGHRRSAEGQMAGQ